MASEYGIQAPQSQYAPSARSDRKKPWLAALLGFLIFGAGHMYLGLWVKGILLLIVAVLVSLFTAGIGAIIFLIISPLWAYYDAKTYNREAGYPE
jgi:TM2 domain-containing membrane protein YozV